MGKINVTLGQPPDRPVAESFAVAAVADELGYDELWIGEMAVFDAFALATAIGLQTERITPVVGPVAVSVRTPVNIAMGAATVETAIGRPVNIALGTSSSVVVSEWHGADRSRSAVRLEESIQIVRRLLGGEKVDYVGDVLSSRGYRLRLDPPRSTVSVAAFGERAVRVAARHGDRMVVNMVTARSAKRLCDALEIEASAVGRQRPTVAVWLAASVDPQPEDRDALVRSKTGYLAAPGYAEMFEEAGFTELVALARTRPHPRDLRAAIPDDEMIDAVCLGGSIDHVQRRIDEYFAAGVDEICVVPSTASDPGARRTLAALASLR